MAMILVWIILCFLIFMIIRNKMHFVRSISYLIGAVVIVIFITIIIFIKDKFLQRIHILQLAGVLLPIIISVIAILLFDIAPRVIAIAIILAAILGVIIHLVVFKKAIQYLINYFKRDKL